MTLAEVVRGCREEIAARLKKDYPTLSGSEVLDVIEADPDFTLPYRVEKLAADLNHEASLEAQIIGADPMPGETAMEKARVVGRLRALLEWKP